MVNGQRTQHLSIQHKAEHPEPNEQIRTVRMVIFLQELPVCTVPNPTVHTGSGQWKVGGIRVELPSVF